MRHTTILLADGDPNQLALYSEILRHVGYHTLTTARGDSAVRLAQLHHPAAVVTEIALPGLSGFAVARTIRGHPGTAAIPVLVLSVRESAADRLEAEQAGCTGYLVKPCPPRWLLEEIRWQLRHSVGAQRAAASEAQSSAEAAATAVIAGPQRRPVPGFGFGPCRPEHHPARIGAA